MFKSRAPRVAKHAFKYANNFRTDVGFSGRIRKFKRVKGDWVLSVSWIKINNVFNAILGNETQVIDCEVTVRVNDTVALIIEDVRESKEL